MSTVPNLMAVNAGRAWIEDMVKSMFERTLPLTCLANESDPLIKTLREGAFLNAIQSAVAFSFRDRTQFPLDELINSVASALRSFNLLLTH